MRGFRRGLDVYPPCYAFKDLTIDGQRYAASIYSEPHGESAIDDNGYPGHLCVHFLNSRTHGTDRVDEDHQKMILKAYRAG